MKHMALMNAGMKCLIAALGEVGAGRFIAQIIRESFDYTKWQKNLFDGMSVEEISAAAAIYCQENSRS